MKNSYYHTIFFNSAINGVFTGAYACKLTESNQSLIGKPLDHQPLDHQQHTKKSASVESFHNTLSWSAWSWFLIIAIIVIIVYAIYRIS